MVEYNNEWHRRYYAENRERISARRKELRTAHPERSAEYNRSRKHRDPETWLLNIARARAKKRGLPFEITREDIVIPDRCPILDVPISPSDGTVSPTSLSLDRKDSSKGYVPGNVFVISHLANNYKRDMDINVLRRLLQYMES